MSEQTAQEVSLQDVFNQQYKNIFLSMNCHAIGKITQFNSANQTCTVKINYDKKFFKRENETSREIAVPYPLLTDVPVIVLTGGGAGLTMPIKKGDDCALLFNDRDVDNWFNGKNKGFANSNRLHSMSDALALVGLRSLKESLENYDPDNPVLFNGSTRIVVKENKLLIENQIETLNTLLQDLITEVKAITTVGSATNQSVSPASQVLLDGIATRIGSLLE